MGGVDCEAVEGIEEVCLAETVEVQDDVCGCCGAEGVGDEVAHFARSKNVDFPMTMSTWQKEGVHLIVRLGGIESCLARSFPRIPHLSPIRKYSFADQFFAPLPNSQTKLKNLENPGLSGEFAKKRSQIFLFSREHHRHLKGEIWVVLGR